MQGARVDALLGISRARPDRVVPAIRDAALLELYEELHRFTEQACGNVPTADREEALAAGFDWSLRALTARAVLAGVPGPLSADDPAPALAVRGTFTHAVRLVPYAKGVIVHRLIDLARRRVRIAPMPPEPVPSPGPPVPEQAWHAEVLRRARGGLEPLLRWVAKLPESPREFMRWTLARLPAFELVGVIAIDRSCGLNLGIAALPALASEAQLAAALDRTPANVQTVRGNVRGWAASLPFALAQIAALADPGRLAPGSDDQLRRQGRFTATLAWCATLPERQREPVRHALASLPAPWNRRAVACDAKQALGLELGVLAPDPTLVDRFTADVRSAHGPLREAAENVSLAHAWVSSLV